MAHLHRHGHVKLPDMLGVISAAGLQCVEQGPVGLGTLHFVLAEAPC